MYLINMAAVVKYFTDYIDWLLHGSRPRPQPQHPTPSEPLPDPFLSCRHPARSRL